MWILRHLLCLCAFFATGQVLASDIPSGQSSDLGASASYLTLSDMNQNQAFRSKPNLFRYPQFAKVHFLVDKSDAMGFDYSEQQFDLENATKCQELGFKTEVSTCTTAGQNAGQLCPYDTSYTNICCGIEYKYKKGECSYPRTISSASCNNKYKCYCDTTLYPYTTDNCASPYVLADKCVDDSGSHYAECACPSYYKPCDSSNNLVGIGTACTRNGETVYEACECKSDYKYVCEQFGPTRPNDYCLSGLKYYTECKTCGDLGFVEGVCPAGIDCSFEQCSGKYYPTGKCTLGYIDIDGASCDDWYKYWMPCSEAPERPAENA